MTLNSPATLCELYSYSTRPFLDKETAERVRESSERAAVSWCGLKGRGDS